jgi:multiple antibiotic resistance protein
MINNIATITLTLFAVIDILGSLPVIVSLRKKHGHIKSEKATLAAYITMICFLFVGEAILKFIGLDLASFSIAGAVVLTFLGLEMILGLKFFKEDETNLNDTSIFPIAFPLIAGPGTLTSLLSLNSLYSELEIIIGITINLILVYPVLKKTAWLERKIGDNGMNVLRKVFGIILLAIAVKMFKTNILS